MVSGFEAFRSEVTSDFRIPVQEFVFLLDRSGSPDHRPRGSICQGVSHRSRKIPSQVDLPMSHALQPFVSEDIENGDAQTPQTAAEHRPSCKVAAGGVLLLMIAFCVGLWKGGRAWHFDHSHTLHGPDFDAINFESIRAEDEFLNLGPGSVCRGEKVDAHLGPTGREGMVLSNTNPKKDAW